MNDSQRTAWQRLSHRFLVDGLSRGPLETLFVPQAPIDPAFLFGRAAPLLVEIGAGSGENLATAATARPSWNLLGFEVYDKVLGSAMSKLERVGADNVKLLRGDAVTGLEYLLTPGSITELHTFFPDPWHKARHAKRRLISAGFVQLVASRLAAGGLWRLATDWDDYAAHIRAVFEDASVSRYFEDATGSELPGWSRPETKFEARATAAGRAVTEFVYRRTAVPAGSTDSVRGSAGVSPATGGATGSTTTAEEAR